MRWGHYSNKLFFVVVFGGRRAAQKKHQRP
jgi:hypothetical protein